MLRYTEEEFQRLMAARVRSKGGDSNAVASVVPGPPAGSPPSSAADGDSEAPFVIFPYPVSANKYWRYVGQRVLVSRDGRLYKKAVTDSWGLRGLPKLDGPLALHIRLHPKMTKGGKASNTRVDLGNCEKIVSDALNGLAWNDDKQLVRILLELSTPVKGGALSLRVQKTEEPE